MSARSTGSSVQVTDPHVDPDLPGVTAMTALGTVFLLRFRMSAQDRVSASVIVTLPLCGAQSASGSLSAHSFTVSASKVSGLVTDRKPAGLR